jgi:hypothetical protein
MLWKPMLVNIIGSGNTTEVFPIMFFDDHPLRRYFKSFFVGVVSLLPRQSHFVWLSCDGGT